LNNDRVAEIFDELADRLELLGENPFKTRAYRTFAVEVRNLSEPLSAVHARGEHRSLAVVGRAIGDKIDALFERGTFDALDRARAATPTGLLEVLRVPGIGSKTVQALWHHADVTTLEELLAACDDDRVANVPGLGKKKQEKIHGAVRILLGEQEQVLLAVALEAAALVRATLEAAGASRVALVGNARRGIEVVAGVELIALGLAPSAIAEAIKAADDDLLVRAVSESQSDVHLVLQGRGDIHLVTIDDPKAWFVESIVRTGDDAHVRWLEDRASAQGGLRRVGYGAQSEEAVYAALDLPYVPPELREGPRPNVPVDLLAPDGIRGVFHVHTDWSDGTSSIVDMARSAARAGFEYVGISDHSQAASYANGLDASRLSEQIAAVAEARLAAPEIRIFHGIEVDILPDGSLDLDDAVLGALDFVIASVHARFNMSAEEMTCRLVRAVSHPLVTILGHPTGRLLLGRKGYVFDIEAVAKAAVSNGTYLEINANAHRLDLSPPLVRKASIAGALFAINPDAHNGRGFEDVQLGVMLARRSGLASDRVFNTAGKDEMTKLLHDRRARAPA
jgi:DNA polymerase (family X)